MISADLCWVKMGQRPRSMVRTFFWTLDLPILAICGEGLDLHHLSQDRCIRNGRYGANVLVS